MRTEQIERKNSPDGAFSARASLCQKPKMTLSFWAAGFTRRRTKCGFWQQSKKGRKAAFAAVSAAAGKIKILPAFDLLCQCLPQMRHRTALDAGHLHLTHP